MRAERLLGIVTTLQARGRCTAPELAAEFEVSAKTIQRDMEALSRAGVPVFALRGANGGWELLPDYRSTLTGLTPEEALAIVVGRPQSFLGDLGIEDRGDGAIAKLIGALPAHDRNRAARAGERLLVDPDLWTFASEEAPFLPDLYRAVCDDLVVRWRYGDRASPYEVAPLGIVFKRSAWYVVARDRDQNRTYRFARVRALDVTGHHFDRPGDFDLTAYWATSTAAYAETIPAYPVELRLRGDALERARDIWVRHRAILEADDDGWAAVELVFHSEADAVAAVRRLGGEVRIVSPDSLRDSVVAEAKAILHANVAPSARGGRRIPGPAG